MFEMDGGCVRERRQASQYARSLIEASLDPLMTISAEGKITDANEARSRTGAPRERLVDSDFSSYFTEPEKARRGYQLAFAEGLVADYPLTIRHADGKLTDVLYNASVYKDTQGDVLGVFAAARDITDRKRAEAILQEIQSFAEAIVETVREPLLVLDQDLHVMMANESFCAPSGPEGGETEGHLLYELGNGQWTSPSCRRLLEDIMPAAHGVPRFRGDSRLSPPSAEHEGFSTPASSTSRSQQRAGSCSRWR